MTGTLYITATPIGNMEDITLRAVRILSEADAVCAEDTRRTGLLLKKLSITNTLISLHEYSDSSRIEEVVELLRSGKNIALVSDAGTPLISDPGSYLVRRAREEGIAVCPVPGACAAIAALSAFGFPGEFTFVGFLEKSGEKRRAALARIMESEGVSVLYESPRRLCATLADIAAIDEGRLCGVARELTKLYEETVQGGAKELLERFSAGEVRGEIVLVVSGAEKKEASDGDIIREYQAFLAAGETKKEAAKLTAEKLHVNRNRVKKLCLY